MHLGGPDSAIYIMYRLHVYIAQKNPLIIMPFICSPFDTDIFELIAHLPDHFSQGLLRTLPTSMPSSFVAIQYIQLFTILQMYDKL